MFRASGYLILVSTVVAILLVFTVVMLSLAGLMSANAIFVLPSVSAVLAYVTWIVVAKAFYSIKAPLRQEQLPVPAQSATSAIRQVKYCPHCGAQNRVDASYCVRCGKTL